MMCYRYDVWCDIMWYHVIFWFEIPCIYWHCHRWLISPQHSKEFLFRRSTHCSPLWSRSHWAIGDEANGPCAAVGIHWLTGFVDFVEVFQGRLESNLREAKLIRETLAEVSPSPSQLSSPWQCRKVDWEARSAVVVHPCREWQCLPFSRHGRTGASIEA